MFPLLVKALKDGVDDSLHAGQVDEADHGASPPAHFDEASFNDVGGSQLAPQMRREGKERGAQVGAGGMFQSIFGVAAHDCQTH